MEDDKHYPDCYYCTQYIRGNKWCKRYLEHKCYGDWCEYGEVDSTKLRNIPLAKQEDLINIEITCSKCGETKTSDKFYRGKTCKVCQNRYLSERYLKTKRACLSQLGKYSQKCLRCHQHTPLPAIVFTDYNGNQIHINFKGISVQRALEETILSLPICKNCYAIHKFMRNKI